MKIKTVLKGILFYSTVLSVFIFIAGVDDLFDKGYLIPSLIGTVALILMCRVFLNRRDIDRLLFMD